MLFQVQKIELNFLRKPKVLNMKKLKAAVWHRLCENFEENKEVIWKQFRFNKFKNEEKKIEWNIFLFV